MIRVLNLGNLFYLEITSHGNVQDTFIYEEVKELLDEKISRGRKVLLKDFQDLE